MGRRTVSLDDGSLRFRYFGKFQCGIAVFYYFLRGFAVFGPSLRSPQTIHFPIESCGLGRLAVKLHLCDTIFTSLADVN